MTMMEWADEQDNATWNSLFLLCSLNRAVWHLKDGKISPGLYLIVSSKRNVK